MLFNKVIIVKNYLKIWKENKELLFLIKRKKITKKIDILYNFLIIIYINLFIIIFN